MTTAITHTNGSAPEISTAQKIHSIGNYARNVFIEREDAIQALEVCFACGEHLCMLGAPGTTKSAMVRYFANAMSLNFFRTVLNADTVREDLFGPIKVSALAQDRWERKWSALAIANIALLDEVGKASSQVLNMLLDAMEERLARSADIEIPLPIHSIIGASNETLDDETQAIWDRFTLRILVRPVSNSQNFVAMLDSDPENPPTIPISVEELSALRAKTTRMALSAPVQVKEVLAQLWSGYANQSPAKISDRRWKRVLKAAAGKALLEGRGAIDPADLEVAKWVIWDVPSHGGDVYKEYTKIEGWVKELTHAHMSELLDAEELLSELVQFLASQDLNNLSLDVRTKKVYEASKLIRLAKKGISQPGGFVTRWQSILDTTTNLSETLMG